MEYFVDLLKKGEAFSFSRWGDGEWTAVMGPAEKEKRNCDGHAYFPEMGRMLRAILKSRPPYFMAMQTRGMGSSKKFRAEGLRKQWYSWLEENRIDLAWHEAVIFHEASWKGGMGTLAGSFRGRPLVMVGPAHLRKLDSGFVYEKFIEVPGKNCFLAIDRTEEEIRDALRGMPAGSVLSLSCAMSANILIDRLFPDFGKKCFMIDFGSVWDPYVGIKSRSYHHRMAAEYSGQC